MTELPWTSSASKEAAYRELQRHLAGVLAGERNGLANTANMAALLFHSLPAVNWAGFYFLQGKELVLGPFQGKVACARLPIGRGVCGSAARHRETLVVPDVHTFPGHIACDTASRSEIVVPLIRGDRLLGVLDLDSPELGRFDHVDRQGLQQAVTVLLEASELDPYVGE